MLVLEIGLHRVLIVIFDISPAYLDKPVPLHLHQQFQIPCSWMGLTRGTLPEWRKQHKKELLYGFLVQDGHEPTKYTGDMIQASAI